MTRKNRLQSAIKAMISPGASASEIAEVKEFVLAAARSKRG